MSNSDPGNKKSMFREIFLEGVVKFAGEIIGVILLAAFWFFFPVLKSWVIDHASPKDDADRAAVVISQDAKPAATSQTELQKVLEQYKQEEKRLKTELQNREEALKEAKARETEEVQLRAELQRKLERSMQEEERLNIELKSREKALKEAKTREIEEVRLRTELQSELERHKQEEERLKAELKRSEEALREVEARKPKLPAMSDEEFIDLCSLSNASKVEEAIHNGADVNARDNDGWTALMLAALFGRTETARVLLQNGAYVNAMNNNGDTALILAAAYGHKETANLLRSYGAK